MHTFDLILAIEFEHVDIVRIRRLVGWLHWATFAGMSCMVRTNEDGGAGCIIERLELHSERGTRADFTKSLTPVNIFLNRRHALERLALATEACT